MSSSPSFRVTAVVVVLVAALPIPSNADETVLSDVPTYFWYHGCSPASGMMVLSYWDSYGYSNLIPGSNNWDENQTAIQNAIASSGHIADYALYGLPPDITISSTRGQAGIARNPDGSFARPWEDYGQSPPFADLSTISPGSAHSDDCLADFMGTSRSNLGLPHGSTRAYDLLNPWTWDRNISTGMKNYAGVQRLLV